MRLGFGISIALAEEGANLIAVGRDKKKLEDLWNDGTGVIPIVGALIAVVAAPIYAYFSLT